MLSSNSMPAVFKLVFVGRALALEEHILKLGTWPRSRVLLLQPRSAERLQRPRHSNNCRKLLQAGKGANTGTAQVHPSALKGKQGSDSCMGCVRSDRPDGNNGHRYERSPYTMRYARQGVTWQSNRELRLSGISFISSIKMTIPSIPVYLEPNVALFLRFSPELNFCLICHISNFLEIQINKLLLHNYTIL